MTSDGKGMTIAGVGPRWVGLSVLSCAPFVALRILWPEAVSIPWVPRVVVVALAMVLMLAGTALFVSAVLRLMKGFPQGQLFTGGPYALCRHPIYASWIVFLVPASVLLANNWAGLLATIPMYIALRILVRKEEKWLEDTFGDSYRAYRNRVGPVLPIPRHFPNA